MSWSGFRGKAHSLGGQHSGRKRGLRLRNFGSLCFSKQGSERPSHCSRKFIPTVMEGRCFVQGRDRVHMVLELRLFLELHFFCSCTYFPG